MKPIGILANLEKPQVPRVVRALIRQLARLRESYLLERGLAESLGRAGGMDISEVSRRCRLLIVLGGDGTVLRAAREVYPRQIPMFPVNLGTLGFLAAVSPNSLSEALPIVLKGKGYVSDHATLDVVVRSKDKKIDRMMALNDAVISRGAVSRVAELGLYVDGDFLNSYVCDGVIFSTPTGSTAYSLSAGGAIVVPTANVFSITPICPHAWSNRSIIVRDRSTVETRIISLPDELYLSLDGQRMIPLSSNDRVRVTIGKYRVRMITLPGSSFFELLRRKLHWTGSHL